MSLAQLIPIAMSISLFTVVLVLGMKTRLEDLSFLLRNPGLLIRSILAMNVIMLGFAVALSQLFDLNPTIKIALVALAVSPVPPLLPGKQIKAGGTETYAVGLLAAASAVAIVLVPVSIELMEADKSRNGESLVIGVKDEDAWNVADDLCRAVCCSRDDWEQQKAKKCAWIPSVPAHSKPLSAGHAGLSLPPTTSRKTLTGRARAEPRNFTSSAPWLANPQQGNPRRDSNVTARTIDTRSARGCHLCLRYSPLPMSPGRTRTGWLWGQSAANPSLLGFPDN